jgi:hypothetical protein
MPIGLCKCPERGLVPRVFITVTDIIAVAMLCMGGSQRGFDNRLD